MSDSSETKCPVCCTRSRQEALASQQLILMGVQGYLDRDDTLINDVYESLTQYDGHTAIAVITMLLSDMCAMTGADPHTVVSAMRQQFTNAQAATTE